MLSLRYARDYAPTIVRHGPAVRHLLSPNRGVIEMATPTVQTTIQDQMTSALPIALGVVAGGAVLAFSIKGVWVAWRAGSKALGKAGG